MATSPDLVQFQWSLLDKTGLQWVVASLAASSLLSSTLTELEPSEESPDPEFEAVSSEKVGYKLGALSNVVLRGHATKVFL